MKKVLDAIIFADKTKLTNEQWLEQRRKGIGGSDAAAIMGLDRYKSAFQVFFDKTQYCAEEDNEAMRQGRDLEAYVASRFEEQTGKKTRNCNYILQNPDNPFMLANVDRLVVGERAGLECKTTSILNKTDFSGGDVPPNYYVQCVHYLAVTGADRWYLAILVLNKGFYVFTVERNEEDIAALRKAEYDFWNNNILARVEPSPDGSEKTRELIGRLYGAEDKYGEVAIDLMGYSKELAELCTCKAQIKDLQAREETLKQIIQVFMKDATTGFCEGYKVTWRNEERSTIDTARLKTELPDTYSNYLKSSKQRKFFIKEI